MDALTDDVRKDVPGSMMFADDIVLCGDDETDMTEYLETWRKALEERGKEDHLTKNPIHGLKSILVIRIANHKSS